jgi:hypothetical protein
VKATDSDLETNNYRLPNLTQRYRYRLCAKHLLRLISIRYCPIHLTGSEEATTGLSPWGDVFAYFNMGTIVFPGLDGGENGVDLIRSGNRDIVQMRIKWPG